MALTQVAVHIGSTISLGALLSGVLQCAMLGTEGQTSEYKAGAM
jgi:hypothetical protein